MAEPFTAVAGRGHAVLSTGLGPAFVLAASGGKTAAARAVEAAQRLNGAAAALRTTVGLNLEARGLDANPVLALAGRPEVLLEVAEEDAAAYNEDWTSLRGRGGPVTRARLARWWEALARDLVLLTIRGEKPRFAAAIAPEGRVLAQVFEAAQRTGRPGVPRQVIDEARPPLRDGLKLLALRVPASVTAPVAAAAAASLPTAAATPAPARLQLEGTWGGSQVEQGQRQYISVAFQRSGGSISYEGGITLTVPLHRRSSRPGATRCVSASRSAAAFVTTRGSGTARRSPARSRRTRRDATRSRPSSCAGGRAVPPVSRRAAGLAAAAPSARD